MKILIINGPNLNKLGEREPDKYGKFSLADLQQKLNSIDGVEISMFQSAIEGELVNAIIDSKVEGIVLNAGAYTHYSYAIRDAIATTNTRVVEVHITNTAAREEFRNTSVISAVAYGTITGFGMNSYILAVKALME